MGKSCMDSLNIETHNNIQRDLAERNSSTFFEGKFLLKNLKYFQA